MPSGRSSAGAGRHFLQLLSVALLFAGTCGDTAFSHAHSASSVHRCVFEEQQRALWHGRDSSRAHPHTGAVRLYHRDLANASARRGSPAAAKRATIDTPLRLHFDISQLNTHPSECKTSTGTVNVTSAGSGTVRQLPCNEELVLSPNKRTFLEDVLNDIKEFVGSSMQLKASLRGDVQLGASSKCDPWFKVDGKYSSFAADIVVYVTAFPIRQASVQAVSSVCTTDSASGRALLGTVNVSPAEALRGRRRRRTFVVLLHEVYHLLGVASIFYDKYPAPPKPVLAPATLGGMSTKVMTTPLATAAYREHFDCAALAGVELEEYDSTAQTASSHWEKRSLPNEIMAPTIEEDAVVSRVTLSFFADLGWYDVDVERNAEPLVFGRGRGCSFAQDACAGRTKAGYEPCTGTYTKSAAVALGVSPTEGQQQCTFDRLAAARCDASLTDPWQPGCGVPRRYAFVNGRRGPTVLCSDDSTSTADAVYGEQYSGESRCFHSTVTNAPSSAYGARCFPHRCENGTLRVVVAGRAYDCPGGANAPVAVDHGGYKGMVLCPAYGDLCCPKPCFRGFCHLERCICEQGWSGENCREKDGTVAPSPAPTPANTGPTPQPTPAPVPAPTDPPELTDLVVVARGSLWNYTADAQEDDAWREAAFEQPWLLASCPIGFARDTVADNGAEVAQEVLDANSIILELFLRRRVLLPQDPLAVRELTFSVRSDNSHEVYLNGLKVADTESATAPIGETYWEDVRTISVYDVLDSMFPGENWLAVRVENAPADVRDMFFDMELRVAIDVKQADAVRALNAENNPNSGTDDDGGGGGLSDDSTVVVIAAAAGGGGFCLCVIVVGVVIFFVARSQRDGGSGASSKKLMKSGTGKTSNRVSQRGIHRSHKHASATGAPLVVGPALPGQNNNSSARRSRRSRPMSGGSMMTSLTSGSTPNSPHTSGYYGYGGMPNGYTATYNTGQPQPQQAWGAAAAAGAWGGGNYAQQQQQQQQQQPQPMNVSQITSIEPLYE